MKCIEFGFWKDPENQHGELYHEARKNRQGQKKSPTKV